ncbi:unnamed protein product [Alopecurus aequalis]
MGCGEVKLQFIEDRAKRNRSQNMRLPHLVKSTKELAVLCDAPTCLIAYPPGVDQPVVFPSKEAAADVLRRYNELGKPQRLKHKLDYIELVQKRVEKAEEQLYNLHRWNCLKELNLILADFYVGRCENFNDLPPHVKDALEWSVGRKRQDINARLQNLQADAMQLIHFEPASVQPTPLKMAQPSPPNMSTPLLQDDVQDPVVPVPKDVVMVEPLVMMSAQIAVPVGPLPEEDVPVMVDLPVYNASGAPMTLDGEPRYGSYLFEVLDACDVNGDGSGLPTNEEVHSIFVKAGISTAPQPK